MQPRWSSFSGYYWCHLKSLVLDAAGNVVDDVVVADAVVDDVVAVVPISKVRMESVAVVY